MSNVKSTPKTSSKPKEAFMKLFSCGSAKKPIPSTLNNAPENVTGETDDSIPVDRDIKTVMATKSHPIEDDEEVELCYTDMKVIGKGTFGIVYKVTLCHNSEKVAIKKVFDDKRYKNRELLFMKQLQHPNITNLMYYFYTDDAGCRKGERYLNMVLEFVPQTLFSIAKCDGMYTKPLLDPMYIKVYTFQLFRCLNYLHSLNICHRDIKPQNILIDPSTHVVKLCDFGSAKELMQSESNVAYICSRYYRAPELIFGSKNYGCIIDLWSAGCVLAELFQGHPLFPGATGPDQMVEIMKILGTPTYEDIMDINHNVTSMRLPPVLVPLPWHKVFTKQTLSYDATDLIAKLLVFSPKKRMNALDACAHPFFNDLKSRAARLPDGRPLPPLFNVTSEEMASCPNIKEKLVPIGWSEEWDLQSGQPSFGFLEKSQFEKDEGGLKNKIAKLAKTSFRKTSLKKETSPYRTGFEIEETEHNPEPTRDISELVESARRNLERSPSEIDAVVNVEHHVADLSLKTTPEPDSAEKKKKKKKQKERSDSMEDMDSMEQSLMSPNVTALHGNGRMKYNFNDNLDSMIPVKDENDVEDDSMSREEKPKKKKKSKRNQLGSDSNADEMDGSILMGDKWRHGTGEVWNNSRMESFSGDAVRAVSSSTPADFQEISDTRVKKKKVKKQRSRDNSLHGSFDDLDSAEVSLMSHNRTEEPEEAKITNKRTKTKRTEVIADEESEPHYGSHVVHTVVSTTTTSVERPKKAKKKSARQISLEDEV